MVRKHVKQIKLLSRQLRLLDKFSMLSRIYRLKVRRTLERVRATVLPRRIIENYLASDTVMSHIIGKDRVVQISLSKALKSINYRIYRKAATPRKFAFSLILNLRSYY